MSYFFDQTMVSDSTRSTSRGPWGEVPISSVFGYDYPLAFSGGRVESENYGRHRLFKDSIDRLVRTSRAASESRYDDPYYTSAYTSDLSFWPMALRSSRGNSPYYSRAATPEPMEASRARERFSNLESEIVRARNRARSLSPFRSYSPFRETTPPPPTARQILSNISDSLSSSAVPRTIIDPNVYRDSETYLPVHSSYTRYPTGGPTLSPSELLARRQRRAYTPGPNMEPSNTTSISYSSTNPWNSTGFYYSPRYPEAYRGTSSTYPPYAYSRRYYDYDIFNPYRIEYFKYPEPRKDYGYVPYKYSRKHMLTRSKI